MILNDASVNAKCLAEDPVIRPGSQLSDEDHPEQVDSGVGLH